MEKNRAFNTAGKMSDTSIQIQTHAYIFAELRPRVVFWVYFRDEQADSHLVGETSSNGNASCHLLANRSAAAGRCTKPCRMLPPPSKLEKIIGSPQKRANI